MWTQTRNLTLLLIQPTYLHTYLQFHYIRCIIWVWSDRAVNLTWVVCRVILQWGSNCIWQLTSTSPTSRIDFVSFCWVLCFAGEIRWLHNICSSLLIIIAIVYMSRLISVISKFHYKLSMEIILCTKLALCPDACATVKLLECPEWKSSSTYKAWMD